MALGEKGHSGGEMSDVPDRLLGIANYPRMGVSCRVPAWRRSAACRVVPQTTCIAQRENISHVVSAAPNGDIRVSNLQLGAAVYQKDASHVWIVH